MQTSPQRLERPLESVVFRTGSNENVSDADKKVAKLRRTAAPACAGLPLAVVAPVLALAEAIVVLISAYAAKYIYLDLYLQSGEPVGYFAVVALCMAVTLYSVYRHNGLYEIAALAGPDFNIGKLWGGLIVAVLIVLGILYFAKEVAWLSRGWMFIWAAILAVSIVLLRFEAMRRVKRGMATGLLLQRTAIIGVPEFAIVLAQKIRNSEGHFRAIDLYTYQSQPDDEHFVGGLDVLEHVMSNRPYDQVIVASPGADVEAFKGTVRVLGAYSTDLLLCNDISNQPISTSGVRELAGARMDVVHLVPRSVQWPQFKRAFDLTMASCLLVILSPLLLLIALAIKLDSSGSVIFQQRRLGQNSVPFWIYKFRTMKVSEDGPSIKQATRNDDRVTRVGKYLRRFSLDELPQLLNVIAGQMSIVGPRPHAIAHDVEFDHNFDLFSRRRRVKPGITGLAQVNGFRGETKTPDDVRGRMDCDLYYIDHWSIWFDIEIVIRTVFTVGRGAY